MHFRAQAGPCCISSPIRHRLIQPLPQSAYRRTEKKKWERIVVPLLSFLDAPGGIQGSDARRFIFTFWKGCKSQERACFNHLFINHIPPGKPDKMLGSVATFWAFKFHIVRNPS